jgi:hypothetical protein
LLYTISGLESNGSLLMSYLPRAPLQPESEEARAAEHALDCLSAFVQLASPPALLTAPEAGDHEAVAGRVRAAAYNRIATAATQHLLWLRLGDEAAWTAAVDSLTESIAILAETGAARYAEVLHLSRLLLRGIEETAERAIRRIPAPAASDTRTI